MGLRLLAEALPRQSPWANPSLNAPCAYKGLWWAFVKWARVSQSWGFGRFMRWSGRRAAFLRPMNSSPTLIQVVGAVLFGLGWGLVGLCPGPALAALTTGEWQAFVFVGALVAGMALFRLTLDRNA